MNALLHRAWFDYNAFAIACGTIHPEEVNFVRDGRGSMDQIDKWCLALTTVYDNCPEHREEAFRLLRIFTDNAEIGLSDFEKLCNFMRIAKTISGHEAA